MATILTDKNSMMQVLGCLIQQPMLFAEIGGERGLDKTDFDDKLARIVFTAIFNLYQRGNTVITVVDIDQYLGGIDLLYREFKDRNGLTYIQDCISFSSIQNFQYHYKRIRKFSVLRKLQKNGINISHIYNTDIQDISKRNELLEKFDDMSIADIFREINKPISAIEYQYNTNANRGSAAHEGIRELIEELKQAPEIGVPLQGHIYNTIVRGARLGKFYINSAGTGTGKTRTLIGDACHISYPYTYSWEVKNWIHTGGNEKSLIITTEMQKDEIQTMIIAYISGVNEEKILYNTYNEEEQEVIEKTLQLMEKYSNNLFIELLGDPDAIQIQSITRRHYVKNEVQYLFFDYIAIGEGVMREHGKRDLRNDEILGLLSTALKNLALELDIFVMSATQLSGDYENYRGIRNQNFLRGQFGPIMPYLLISRVYYLVGYRGKLTI